MCLLIHRGIRSLHEGFMKKVLFVTKAPQGTLGDLTSCVKAINHIREQYSNEVHPSLLVLVDETYHDNVKRVISSGIDYTILAESKSKEKEFESPEAKERLNEADLVVIYPCAHLLTESMYTSIEKSNKPIILSTEYNPVFSSRQLNANWGGNISQGFPPLTAHYMETGFSTREKKRLGIFIEPNIKNQPSETLSNIQDEKDFAFRDLLLETSSGNDHEYFKSHDMYFGYYNNLNFQSPDQGVDCNVFLDLCISKSIKKASESGDKKTIDIIMPLRSNSELISAKELFSNLNRYDLKQFRFEFYEKNADSQMECKIKLGEGDNVVRIMNPFNINSKTMSLLIKLSDPLCYITGDQSLSEAFSNDKLIIYQIMEWKKALGNGILETIENKMGKESALHEFFKLQVTPFGSRNEESYNTQMTKLKEFILTNEEELLKEMRVFRDILFQDENLSNNLTNAIIEYLNMPEENRINQIKEKLTNNKELYLYNLNWGENPTAYLKLVHSNQELIDKFDHNHLYHMIKTDIKQDYSHREDFEYFKKNIHLTENEKHHLFIYETIYELNELIRNTRNPALPFFTLHYRINPTSGKAKIDIYPTSPMVSKSTGEYENEYENEYKNEEELDLRPQLVNVIDFLKSHGINMYSEQDIVIDEKSEIFGYFDLDADPESYYRYTKAHIDIEPDVLYSNIMKNRSPSRPAGITAAYDTKVKRGTVEDTEKISSVPSAELKKQRPK